MGVNFSYSLSELYVIGVRVLWMQINSLLCVLQIWLVKKDLKNLREQGKRHAH